MSIVAPELETYFRERELAEIAVAAISSQGMEAVLSGDHLYSAQKHEHWFGVRVEVPIAGTLSGYIRIFEDMAEFDGIVGSKDHVDTHGLRFIESADEIMEAQ